MITTANFFLFYHVWGPTWIVLGWGPGHIRLHTTLKGSRPHYMILEVCWDNLWTLSFGLSQFRGHGSWLVFKLALSILCCMSIVLAMISWPLLRWFWLCISERHLYLSPCFLICPGCFPLQIFWIFFGDKWPTGNAKAHEAVDHLASFCQVERRFHGRKLNRQPLPWDLGFSPPSCNNLGSSKTFPLHSIMWLSPSTQDKTRSMGANVVYYICREEVYGRWNGLPASCEVTPLTTIWRLPIVHDHIERPPIPRPLPKL